MGKTLATRVVITGENEYKQSIINLKNSIGALKAELGAVKAEYHDNANSMDALRAKGELLNKLHDEQTAKIKLVETALASAKTAQQGYADKVEAARANVTRAEEALAKLASTSGTAGASEAKLRAELERCNKELADAERYNEDAQRAVNKLQKELSSTQRALTNTNRSLQENEKYLDEAKRSADGCATSINQYGRKVKEAGDSSKEFGSQTTSSINTLASALAAAGVGKAIKEIADALRACVEASLEFETAMAGVRRTVGGTEAELAAFASAFKGMALEIPSTTTELGKIAETAGQLGIARENVESFTRVMAMLSTTTDLTAENAATMLAQFANITGLTDYERLGSAVAQLGDATATTASKVVEMAQGMAAAASVAGMSATDILAISAAVGSLGIEAQAGSTAMATLISNMYKSVELGNDQLRKFASVAGMSAEEFAKAWRTDAAGALSAFIQGLNDVERNGRSSVVILDELGITNVRQTKAIQGLANAEHVLTDALEQANRAWEENTVLQQKAEIMYGTTESKLRLLSNAFDGVKVAIGDALSPAIGALAEAGTEGFQWAADFIEESPWLVQAITGVASALAVLVGGVTALMVIEKLTPLIAKFNLVLAANPAVLVAAAITGLTAAIVMFAATAKAEEDGLSKATREVTGAYQEQMDAIGKSAEDTSSMVSALEELTAKEHKTAADKAAILGLVQDLNDAVPELSLAYDEQTDSLNMTTQAIERLALAQRKAAELQATQDALVALYNARQDLEEQMTEAMENLEAAKEKLARFDGVEARTRQEQLAIDHATGTMLNAQGAVDRLTAAQEGNEQQIAALESKYDSFTDTLEGSGDAAKNTAGSFEYFTVILKEVQGGYELLAKAQGEAEQSGSLSIATLSKLIETYPELERYLVSTADGYTLTEGALEDYMAAQRAEYQVALNESRQAAISLINQNDDETVAIDAATEAIKRKLEALKAEASAKVSALAAQAPSSGSMYGQYAWVQAQEGYQEAAAAAKAYGDALKDLSVRENELAEMDRVGGMLHRDSAKNTGSSSKGSSSAKAEQDEAMAELETWLADMDHRIFLWSRDESKSDAITGVYEEMQARVHALAEDYRVRGYDETSDQIQKLQTLWWGYADALEKQKQDAYSRELSALETSLENQEITQEDYLDRLAALQSKHLTEGTAEWEKAEKDRQAKKKQFNQDAYEQEKADLEYLHDMGIISNTQFYAGLLELQEKYLEESSEEWRRVNVEIHNYLEKCREAELEAARKSYEEQLSALEDALKDRLALEKEAYDAEVDTMKSAYSDRTAAIKQSFKEQKTALKDGYDQAKESAKAAYEDKKKAIQDELNLEKDRLNAILEGIDAEIQARRELREDADLDAKIAAARKRLEAAEAQREFARTDEDRAEWDKEIVRLREALDKAIQDKEDTEFYRQKEQEKEAVQDQITAAGDAADAALEEAKVEYDAKVKELEADYKAALARLESRQEAALAQAKQDYEEQLAQAKADYERRAEQLKADYESSKSSLEDRLSQAEQRANQKEYSDEVRAIARENDVDLGVAQDMYNANQWYKDTEGYTPYSDGGYSAAKTAAAAASALSTAVAGMVSNMSRTVQNTVKNSASVTINEASSLTEGQIVRTVKKVMDDMGR